MPAKTLNERLRKAKREGTAPAVKATDLRSGVPGKSNHAVKKARQVVGRAQLSDRTVSRKAPPGKGKSKTKMTRAMEPAAYRKRLLHEMRPRNADDKPQKLGGHRGHVEGRKKAPSQMNIKRRGGPLKKSRLHGG
jgi:hypothetical protein